jgi:Flp pilus assembly protein TadD
MQAFFRTVALIAVSWTLAGGEVTPQQITQALRQGHPDEALLLADEALTHSRPTAVLWTLRALAKVQLHDTDNALLSFQKALQLDPDCVPALEGAAEIEYSRGDQDAVSLLKRILVRRPADQTSHAMLATLAYQRGDCKTATQQFQEAGAKASADVRALAQQGACWLKLQEPERAAPIFEEALRMSPDDEKSRYGLAAAQLAAKHPGDALSILNPVLSAGKADARVLNLAAEAYEAEGDTPNAVKLLRQAILSNPDSVENYLDFAVIALIHRSAAVGIDVVTLGLRRLPEEAALYTARGILYVQVGEYDKSSKDFERAETLDSGSVEAAAAIGMQALQTSDLGKAESELRSRISRQPTNAMLYCLLGESLLRGGAAPGSPQFGEAESAARKALLLNPHLASARDLLGRVYLQQGRISDAIRESRTAVAADANDQSALYHLILALRRSGNSKDVPALTEKLSQLRAAALRQEVAERKFALAEGSVK